MSVFYSILSLRGAKRRGNLDENEDCFAPSGLAMTQKYGYLTQPLTPVEFFTRSRDPSYSLTFKLLSKEVSTVLVSSDIKRKTSTTRSLMFARSGWFASQTSGESFGKLRIPLDRIIPSEVEGRPKGVEP